MSDDAEWHELYYDHDFNKSTHIQHLCYKRGGLIEIAFLVWCRIHVHNFMRWDGIIWDGLWLLKTHNYIILIPHQMVVFALFIMNLLEK